MSATSPMLPAALWYAELGYAIFPCAPGRKVPLTEHGLLDATTNKEQIDRWWAEHPDANIAIRTDGLVAIDIDGPDNPWLADQPDKLAELAKAPTSLTPRGGRQHLFRQPAGKTWRNTVSRLAPSVDTRANGGYICVTPSVVDGKPYRWADGPSLHVAPDQLPEPPGWLVELLDAGSSSSSPALIAEGGLANVIPPRQRNQTLARLAGWLRRAGMSATEILAALNRVNIERCSPPLDAREVATVAHSIARYAPDSISVALIEGHFEQDFPQRASRQTLGELLDENLTLPAPIIHGLLRRGETMNVIAPPKHNKSWLVLSMAMSIATGRPWLGMYPTETGRVLILDNELRRPVIAHRAPQVAEALGIRLDEIREQIEIHSLRGQLRNILSLATYFSELEPGRYATIVLDAMYRFMPAGTDENDNGAMAEVYNYIDAYSERLDCAFILVHHTTKGNQSGKSVTDVGAGAGSQARAADTHLVLRPHEQPRAVVLEAAARSWPPIEPVALRWEFPVWRPAPDLDPAALRSERPRRASTSQQEEAGSPAWTAETFVREFIGPEPVTVSQLRDLAAVSPGLSRRRVYALLALAERQGLIQRVRLSGRGGPCGFVAINKGFP